MKTFKQVIALCVLLGFTSLAKASNEMNNDMAIKFIRVVGNYSGTTNDDTIELHFTAPLQWSNGSSCTNTGRVMIDASKSHMISAAYTAYTSGMKVNINADDSLPIRSGACEISFLDIIK